MPTEELRFNATPSFGQYKPFLEQAIPHPAKMNTKLLKFLITHFTKEGDTVLDPMCGSGSTGVVAAVHGRNAVQIDIEEKFIKWAEEARVKVERQEVLGSRGKIRNICGDARKLSDAIVTSPPYSESISKHAGGKRTLERVGISTKTSRSYDIVITSPPYGEAQSGRKIAKEGIRGGKHSPTDLICKRTYMPDKFEKPENISRLPFGNVDAVITSPPYGESAAFHDVEFMKRIQKDLGEKAKKGENKGHFKTEEAGKRNFEKMQDGNIKSDNNISNLPFDAVITSPPYEGTRLKGTPGDLHPTRAWGSINNPGFQENREKYAIAYSESKENIGNLAKETYIAAMLKVYSEMLRVLKPNGPAIIVIKPFIRRKKVVDLPWHTWLLLQKVGFKLAKLYKLRLKNPSFWRTLYKKKYPEVPEIKHEYVLVCRKWKTLSEVQQS